LTLSRASVYVGAAGEAQTDSYQADTVRFETRKRDPGIELEPWLDALDEYVTSRADNLEPVSGQMSAYFRMRS
jgi:hypothetical protein